MTSGKDFISSILIASEKAACIARYIRQNKHLLSLLIQEKKEDEKNTRFVQDFKTLTDVLVQELIKYDLEKQYPQLRNRIYGEESNSFTNTNGESVVVVLNECGTDTSNLLIKVLDGDLEATRLLVECIHSQVSIEDVPANCLPSDCGDLRLEEVAIWIDPIDSTAEYISGEVSNLGGDEMESVSLYGLNNVTVLIGVFDTTTGLPIIGVINQPFHKLEDNRWHGKCYWGISTENFQQTSAVPFAKKKLNKLTIAVSSCEDRDNLQKLASADFEIVSPAGAGYKVLCVILGLVDAFVSSLSSTFFWDTCAGHAILRSMNGNMWIYEDAVKYGGDLKSRAYGEKSETGESKMYSNKGGIIACKDENLVRRIVEVLK